MEARLIALEERLRQTEDVLVSERPARQTAVPAQQAVGPQPQPEDHIAEKGEISLQHYNLVHKFIPMPQAMKIPAAKAAVDKEWAGAGVGGGSERPHGLPSLVDTTAIGNATDIQWKR